MAKAPAADKLSPCDLKALLRVEDGRLYWLVDRRAGRGAGRVTVKSGTEAGCLAATGYRVVRINGVLYLAHRLVWAITHGEWPRSELDHINRERADNHPENLREVTSSQNKANTGIGARNTSGYKGVSWNKKTRKWQVTTTIDGRSRYIGQFTSPEEASAAYQAVTGHKHAI